MVAGPSEILVIADGKNNPDWIAADLLSQAEHDPEAQSILITDDPLFADTVADRVGVELAMLPTARVAAESWNTHGVIIEVAHPQRSDRAGQRARRRARPAGGG